MPAVLAAIALMLLALPSRADDRVPVPAACRALAERAGIPLTLTHAEAARAIAYIRVMVSDDPAVARCRAGAPQLLRRGRDALGGVGLRFADASQGATAFSIVCISRS